MTEQGKMTDAEIVESYISDLRRKTVVSDHTPELIALFEDCQKEADYHSAVGLYGYVSFEEVLEKRGAEWLAEHDAKVRAEALTDLEPGDLADLLQGISEGLEGLEGLANRDALRRAADVLRLLVPDEQDDRIEREAGLK